jgi:hypothetical protein
MRNEKYTDHAQHRDEPDQFIPAVVIADISDLPDWSQLSRPLNRERSLTGRFWRNSRCP